MIIVAEYIGALRKVRIAPGRFELPSQLPKSRILDH